MNIKNAEISKKYAIAFLNLYISKIDEKSFLNIVTFFEYLDYNPGIISIFSLPSLSLSVKNKYIEILLNKFDIPYDFKKLADLLIKQNRLLLFTDVLREMIWLYQDRSGHIRFEITSGAPLGDFQLKTIRNFLENKTGKKVIESYKIDKNLIAGIRAKSSEFFWEYSIRTKLQKLKRLAI